MFLGGLSAFISLWLMTPFIFLLNFSINSLSLYLLSLAVFLNFCTNYFIVLLPYFTFSVLLFFLTHSPSRYSLILSAHILILTASALLLTSLLSLFWYKVYMLLQNLPLYYISIKDRQLEYLSIKPSMSLGAVISSSLCLAINATIYTYITAIYLFDYLNWSRI